MIDSVFKDKLLSALEDTVSNYNAGMDETTAVAKAASDHDFNIKQAERLCELYNTSRTIHHFDTNPDNKAATFPLVKKADVLDLLFDVSNEKLASEVAPGVEPSDYSAPETDFANCGSFIEFEFGETLQKSASDELGVGVNTARFYKQLSSLRKEAEHLEQDARIEVEMANRDFEKLATLLSRHYSAGDMSKIATVVGSLTSNVDGMQVLSTLKGFLPEYVLSCQLKLANVVDTRTIPEESRLIKDIIAHTRASDTLFKEAEEKLAFCEQYESRFSGIVDPYLRDGRKANEMDQFITGDFNFKEAGFGLGLLAGAAMNSLSRASNDLSSMPKNVEKEIDDAGKRLANVHREMLLTDLLNNDPYLSEEDPKVISQYYNNFVELSPELSNNKEVVRSVLRQAVHNGGGGYSPFDASSFLDAEKTLKEIKGTLPPKKYKGDEEKSMIFHEE